MTGSIGPDRKLPHTAMRDVGAAAARLLCDWTWEGQEDVAVLGPEELSYSDLSAIVSDVVGRRSATSPSPRRCAAWSGTGWWSALSIPSSRSAWTTV